MSAPTDLSLIPRVPGMRPLFFNAAYVPALRKAACTYIPGEMTIYAGYNDIDHAIIYHGFTDLVPRQVPKKGPKKEYPNSGYTRNVAMVITNRNPDMLLSAISAMDAKKRPRCRLSRHKKGTQS